MAFGEDAALSTVDFEGFFDGGLQVFVHPAVDAVFDHVEGAFDGVGGDGDAAGHGFEHDQAEGVGFAGEDHDVGGGEVSCQVAVFPVAEEVGLGIFRLQVFKGGAVTDDDFGAGQVEVEEIGDVLLHRHPAEVEGDGTGQVHDRLIAENEVFDIDTAGPVFEVLESVLLQRLLHGACGHHGQYRLLVEGPDEGVGEGQRDGRSQPHVFGEAGVVGAGVGKVVAQAVAPSGPAQGAFGGDVDGVGLKLVEHSLELAIGEEHQGDVRVGRHRYAAKCLRVDTEDFVSPLPQQGDGFVEGSDDAVNLWVPRVRYYRYPHIALLSDPKVVVIHRPSG